MAVRVSIALYTVTVGQSAHCPLSDVACETISPSQNHNLCFDVPGGNAYNGAKLWLWECIDGMDSQKWLQHTSKTSGVLHWQIQYGMDERFCIDAPDLSDGTQLQLWECSGADSQNWNMNYDTWSMSLKGSSTCWDFWEDQQWNGQALHVWQCNGLDNQQFDFGIFHTTPMPHPTSWFPGCLPDDSVSKNGDECCAGCVHLTSHSVSRCGFPELCGTLPWSAFDSKMGMGISGQVEKNGSGEEFAEGAHVLV